MLVVETGDSSIHSSSFPFFLPKGICALLRIDGHQKFSESFVNCINWKYLNILCIQFNHFFSVDSGEPKCRVFFYLCSFGSCSWAIGHVV